MGFRKTRQHKYETWFEPPKKRKNRVQTENDKWEKKQKQYKEDF